MNRQVRLRRYPEGLPSPEDFELVEAGRPEPGEGDLLVEVRHLGMDPFPRLRMRAESRVGPPMGLNAVVDGRGLGVVVESRAPGIAPGDWVSADTGWQDWAVVPAARAQKLALNGEHPRLHLSALGPSGLTAWLTTVAVGGVQAGDTFVFAPAAGSVGVVAGQVAKAAGARTIGVAADAAQAAALGRFGYDVALDGSAADLAERLKAAAPDGVTLFIDGVGGALHDAVVQQLAPRGRVVLLGFIAGYNDAGPPRYGSIHALLMKRARVEGFLLADHAARHDEARQALAALIAAGKLEPVETVHRGLEAAPAAFAGLFAAPAPGKQIVSLKGEE